MLSFLVKITVKSGREDDFVRIIRDAAPKVRAEPDNHAYIFSHAHKRSVKSGPTDVECWGGATGLIASPT